jgi:glycosyltransferase involved in cell wall biosynthesis
MADQEEKRKLRLLFLCNRDIAHPEAGGGTWEAFRLMSRLAKRGHQVTALTGRFPGATSEANIEGVKVLRVGTAQTLMPNVMIKYLRSADLRGFDAIIETAVFGIPFFSPLYTAKPTILVVWHLPRTTLVTELQERWGRVLGTIAGVLALGLEDNLAPTVYRNVPIFTFSQSTKKDLTETGFDEKRVFVVDYALSEGIMTMDMNKNFSPAKPLDKDSHAPFFICLGRLKKYKGVQDALRAFRIVIDRWPDAEMAIVGRGDYEPKLKQLASHIGVLNSVRFMGHVSIQDKVRYLQNAHALIMPSYKEGFATPILEANLCGTIAVASNAIGVAELVRNRETGLIYSCGDWRDLADKMIQVLDRPEWRKSMEGKTLQLTSQFDIAKREAHFLNLFEECLHRIAL